MTAVHYPKSNALCARIGSAPASAGNTARGLTHSTSMQPKEGLGMNSSTERTCDLVHDMSPREYQRQARNVWDYANLSTRELNPWAWVSTTCGYACLNPQHMIVTDPVRIRYPNGVCVYCGVPSGTLDHLLPRNITGEARRRYVATVPACAECNSRIGEFPSPSIAERRARAHASIRKSKRLVLTTPDRTPEELAEFGFGLRSYIEAKAVEKAYTLARLSWPEDPYYDLRAFQKSGIDDPVALGLVDNPSVHTIDDEEEVA